jgi:hypothetical protein
MNEEIAVRKILTSNKVTDLRSLGTLAYKIKCKYENQLKKITEFERNIRNGLYDRKAIERGMGKSEGGGGVGLESKTQGER